MNFTFDDLTFPAADGFTLAGTAYRPEAPRAVVLIASATAVRRRFYDRYCRHLAEHGLAAFCFDYRGVGHSRPKSLRGFRAQMQDWGEQDLTGALTHVQKLWPGLPIGLVGHSAGGQLVGLAANATKLSAMLFIASQSGDWRQWPLKWKPRMLALWYVAIPGISTLWGYLPGALGTQADLPKGVAHQWAQWGRRKNYLMGGKDADRAQKYAELKIPLRAYSFEDDWYAPHAAVDALLGFYSSATKEHRHLVPGQNGAPPIGHFGFFRSERKDLWEETREWLQQKLSSS
ncbi:MAG: alpha/beta hydrolase family protein [Myxococcaceae bacterium]